MHTLDERRVRAPLAQIYRLASDIEAWPTHLTHYRFVRFWERTADGGGVVEMSANRPFGPLHWPTWWMSRMAIDEDALGRPVIRYQHIDGITKGMNVAWTFEPDDNDRMTHVRIVHEWAGPRWPMISRPIANHVIGPVFIHGIASRTLEGLALAAERRTP